jgi:hypothetical protein
MAAPAFTKACVEKAKRDGLHLLKIDFNGKYSSRPGIGRWGMACSVGPEIAERIWELMRDLANAEKRMK